MPIRPLHIITELLGAAALLVTGGFSLPGLGQNTPSTPYQLKASFLYQFAEMTQWPKEAFTNESAPFILGVLGEAPSPEDTRIIEGKTTKNHKVVVKRFKRAQQVTGCQMLFVADSEDRDVAQTLKTLSSQPGLLTVGESESFFQSGGMVTFVQNEDHTFGFEINRTTVARGGLKLAEKLLQLASQSRNYHLVPARLLEIAKHTDWPPEALPENSTFVVGILGTNCFGPDLDRLQNKTVKRRKVVIKQSVTPEEVKGCQILYITFSERNSLLQTLGQLGQASVLTIGEAEDFLGLGGMVNVVVGKNDQYFALNQPAADKAHLSFDSSLQHLFSK